MTDKDIEELNSEDGIRETASDNTPENLPEVTAAEAAEESEAESAGKDTGSPEEKPQTGGVSKMRYYIRILCGGYLVYLSYQLFKGEGFEKPLVKIAAVLFVLAGVFLVLISAKGLMDNNKKE